MSIILFCSDCGAFRCVAHKYGRTIYTEGGLFDSFVMQKIEDCPQRFPHKPETDTDRIVKLDFGRADEDGYPCA